MNRLLDDDRKKLLPPDTVLQHLELGPEHSVADIGCGPGYFSLPMARMARRVYAVDVSEEMLDVLKRRADEAGVENIEPIQALADRIPLQDASVDRILCAFVLHEVDDLPRTLAEFRRLLGPDGKLMVIEWDKKPMEMGPPEHERIEMTELSKRMEEAGFHTECWDLNPYHYVVLARRMG
ncbi:methyltransferase domain-containing protein [Alicyclobacillus sp.]|uniref:class I SAM-dependent methyltransferase n=1 Tax=Alicyclobacillus sp. TaxID=61169 RepID=UPI0025BDAA5C|nr:methyltransferase domain-containing protein [Alicyclobacillus sp.]